MEDKKKEERFSDIGKMEALRRLYAGSSLEMCQGLQVAAEGFSGVVTSSVLMTEGVDFDLVYTPLKHLGYKCALAAIGEVYAKLGQPCGLEVRLGVSAKLDFPQVGELWEGIAAAAREHGVKQVSLDLSASRNGLVIAVSAAGGLLKNLPRAAEPHTMDLICVSDNLGSAYMGLHVLEREKAAFNASSGKQPDLDKYRYIVGAYLRPTVRTGLPEAFAEAGFVPSCGYFVRNGLADAVRRISRDTGLGAKIYVDRIPIADKVFDMASEIGMDPLAAALNGGDDYRFLFVIPIGFHDRFRRDFQTFDVVGHLARPEVGAVIVTPEGAELPLKAQGW